MKRTKPIRRTAAAVLCIGVLAATSSPVSAKDDQEPEPAGEYTAATFEGRVFNMAEDWGDAQACLVDDGLEMPECFATETEMMRRVDELGLGDPQPTETAIPLSTGGGPITAAASSSCSSSLRLYKGSNYSSPTLYLTTRNGWINLSPLNFNQSVSSFKVGACTVKLADGAWGGPGYYPSSLSTPWHWQATLGGGWNNDFTSVYIY